MSGYFLKMCKHLSPILYNLQWCGKVNINKNIALKSTRSYTKTVKAFFTNCYSFKIYITVQNPSLGLLHPSLFDIYLMTVFIWTFKRSIVIFKLSISLTRSSFCVDVLLFFLLFRFLGPVQKITYRRYHLNSPLY